MIIKEKKVDIIKENDQEVIIRDHPGNSVHIMSDNIKGIYLQRCIIASEFGMDINHHWLFIYVQDCSTIELIIQLKIILEKITPVDFDITLLIKNCKRIKYTHIVDIIDHVIVIRKKYINYLEKDTHILFKEYIMKHIPNISKYARTSCCPPDPSSLLISEWISSKEPRSSHPGASDFKKTIIELGIFLNILDNLGHFAQRGHHPSTVIKLDFPAVIKMDILDLEYHILDFSSISGLNYLSITSVINLDIIVKEERFIRTTHLLYINNFNMTDIIRPEQFAEHHMLDHISISRPSIIPVIYIQTESDISDIFAEYHLLDYTSISGPNYISVLPAINIGIYIKEDRFIRSICPSFINSLVSKNIDIETKMFVKNINIKPCLPHQGIFMNIIVEKEESIKNIRISNIHLLSDIDINIKAEWFIRTFSSYINLINDINRKASSDHHLWFLKSHQGSITGISCLLVTSSPSTSILVEKKKLIESNIMLYLNLSYVRKPSSPWDLSHQKDSISIFIVIEDIKVDKFIRTFRPSYINLIKGIISQVPAGDHQQLKSHQAASSMITSEKHIIIVQGIMVKAKGQDIQTYCIYLTTFSLFTSKYSVISESIIDNYFHIILVTLHQWEALCITHLCLSRNGIIRSHRIEKRDISILMVYLRLLRHHLTMWNEKSYNIIKNLYIMDIMLIFNFHIKAVHGHLVMNDIKETESPHKLVQGIRLIKVIIYDINSSNLSIYGLLSMTTGISIIGFIHNIDFHLEYNIYHLESYNTFNIQSYLVFDIKFSISNLNQIIIEPYSTIIEVNAIKNVITGLTSYMDIKTCELYITTGNSDISAYIIISIVELINYILERRSIITAGEGADIKVIKKGVMETRVTIVQSIKVIMLHYLITIN